MDAVQPNARDALVGRVAVFNAILRDHLTTGLQEMLRANGVSETIRDAMNEFIAPILLTAELLREDVLRATDGQRVSVLGYPLEQPKQSDHQIDRDREGR